MPARMYVSIKAMAGDTTGNVCLEIGPIIVIVFNLTTNDVTKTSVPDGVSNILWSMTLLVESESEQKHYLPKVLLNIDIFLGSCKWILQPISNPLLWTQTTSSVSLSTCSITLASSSHTVPCSSTRRGQYWETSHLSTIVALIYAQMSLAATV